MSEKLSLACNCSWLQAIFCLSSEVELLKEHQGGKVRFLEAEFQGGCKRLKRIPHALVKDVYLWREHGELVARMGCNRSMFRREYACQHDQVTEHSL